MLYQLHHQFKNSHKFVAQNEFNPLKTQLKEFNEWLSDVNKSHPLPEGAVWMICCEEDRKFLWAVGRKKNIRMKKLATNALAVTHVRPTKNYQLENIKANSTGTDNYYAKDAKPEKD